VKERGERERKRERRKERDLMKVNALIIVKHGVYKGWSLRRGKIGRGFSFLGAVFDALLCMRSLGSRV